MGLVHWIRKNAQRNAILRRDFMNCPGKFTFGFLDKILQFFCFHVLSSRKSSFFENSHLLKDIVPLTGTIDSILTGIAYHLPKAGRSTPRAIIEKHNDTSMLQSRNRAFALTSSVIVVIH